MSKMNIILYILCISLIAVFVIIMIFIPDGGYKSEINKECIVVLGKFGWEVDKKPVKTEIIQIPRNFDNIYEDYNDLQKECGFDLEQYKGQAAMRYTYIIKNYPNNNYDEIYANVIIINGKVVGGDIMSARLDGFMHSLNI